MSDTVNRQILLVEKPTGKLGPEHFKMVKGADPGAEGRRGAGADALHLARRRQPGLDARRHLSRRGRGQHRDGRRRHRRSRRLESAGPQRRRHRVRRYRLAGLCRRAGQAPDQDAEDGADDASAQRLRHRRPHRLFRPAACRQAQGRRDRRGLGRGRLGRLDRRRRSPRSRAATSSASPAARTSATG